MGPEKFPLTLGCLEPVINSLYLWVSVFGYGYQSDFSAPLSASDGELDSSPSEGAPLSGTSVGGGVGGRERTRGEKS